MNTVRNFFERHNIAFGAAEATVTLAAIAGIAVYRHLNKAKTTSHADAILQERSQQSAERTVHR